MLTDIQITLNPECTIDVQARLNYFKNHAAMENLDYDHSGHTGFASQVYVTQKIAELNIQNGTGSGSLKQKVDATTFTFGNSNSSRNGETITTGASGDFSLCLGGKSKSEGKRATSEGTQTIAQGNYSHAEGNNAISVGANSHAEGSQTISEGQSSHSEGYQTVAKGNQSHSEGNGAKAYAASSHAEGTNTVAGVNNNPSLGTSAHAEGNGTVASGLSSHAEGDSSVASGDVAHAEGRSTASGSLCHAEGKSTARGEKTHSEGIDTETNGIASHAGGGGSQATKDYSFAHGQNVLARRPLSTVFGLANKTVDSIDYSVPQFVIGKYNNPNANNVFEVGFGSGETTRNNVFEVNKNGTAKIGAMGSETLSVTTKGYVDTELNKKADLVNGLIPASQLPSFVDDVIDFEKQVTGADFMAQILATDLGSMVWIAAAKSHTGDTYYRKFAINNDGTQAGITLVTPESGKIYVGKTDTNCFRWSGTNLVEISKSLAIGETASTAYAGNKGKANADAIAAIKNGTTMNDFASVETAIHAIVNIYYPIGSIYLSVNSANPGTLFGGTWEQIKDKFLLAAGDNHSAGSTGGSEDAVTVSHSHSFSGTTSSNRSHMHTGLSRRGLNGSSYTGVESGTAYNGTLDYEVDPYIHTSSDGAHTHTYSGTVGSSGESGNGKNMPPYLTVYMWKRTA